MFTAKFLLEKLIEFLKEKTAILISHKQNIIRVASKIIFLENEKVSSIGRRSDAKQRNVQKDNRNVCERIEKNR